MLAREIDLEMPEEHFKQVPCAGSNVLDVPVTRRKRSELPRSASLPEGHDACTWSSTQSPPHHLRWSRGAGVVSWVVHLEVL